MNTAEFGQASGLACIAASLMLMTAIAGAEPAAAQVLVPPDELDELVARVTLYPDAVLAQLLAASSYPDQIADAARWADEHSYLTDDALAGAIREDNLSWNPSVIALLPFPGVLDMMASNIDWTRHMGNAVLSQLSDVMDAVQRERRRAQTSGHLHSSPQYYVMLTPAGIIEILPSEPFYYYVPIYDPAAVFGRPGARVAAGIRYGPGVFLSAAFIPWGWRFAAIGWPTNTLIIDNHPWQRTWQNRDHYVHPYEHLQPSSGPRVERHELKPHRPAKSES